MYTHVFIYTVKGPAISPITMRCNHIYHLPLTYKSLKCAYFHVYIDVFVFLISRCRSFGVGVVVEFGKSSNFCLQSYFAVL